MKVHLVIDASNILHRTFHMNWASTGDKDDLAGLALHSAFVTLNKYVKKYNPTSIVMAFDRPNWRSSYTKTDECVSKRLYKGTRRQNQTELERRKYADLMEHIAAFEQIVHDHTKIRAISGEGLEADDIIAGFAQMYSDDDTKIVILSADKDLTQLVKYPGVILIDPNTDKPRECPDVDWFMFLKCIRGDKGDNVQSAYPRVRETRLREVFMDEFKRLSFFEETWVDAYNTVFKVKDLYEENRLLMDLECQPDDIRQSMYQLIDERMSQDKTFNRFYFMKFCNKHNLIKLRDSLDMYIGTLSR